jgi:transcriptional regulator with XRE-family HTH domain
MSKFKTFLNKEFKNKNISQNKFAKILGISSVYLGQLLKGEKSPPDRKLQLKISDELELNEQKKKIYFDLIAKEKKDIPTDIYMDILRNEEKWDEIRNILKKKI